MAETETVPNAHATPEFVTRVGNIPLVASTIQQLTAIYNTTKDSHQYVKYTLETAESGVKTVTEKAMLPLVEKLDTPIQALDTMACDQLTKLEDKYPIINKPTGEVYEATLKPTVDKVTAVKDYSVEKVSAVKTYGVETVQGVGTYTTGKVEGVKQASLQTVSNVASYGTDKLQGALQTPVGQKVVSQVDRLMDITDSYLDYYLPEDEATAIEGSDENSCHSNDTSASGDKVSGLGRAAAITDKARRRMYARAMADLKTVKLRTKETIDKLNFTVDLIQYAKTNVDTVQGKVTAIPAKLRSIWDEINMSEEDAVEESTKASSTTTNDITSATFEKRAIATARHMTLKLKRGINTLAPTATLLPDTLKDRVEEVRKYTEQLYTTLTGAGSFKELPGRVLDQTKEKATAMQDTLNEIYKYIQTNIITTWLIHVEYESNAMEAGGSISLSLARSERTPHVSVNMTSVTRVTNTTVVVDESAALEAPGSPSSMPQLTATLKPQSENTEETETESTRDKAEEKKDK